MRRTFAILGGLGGGAVLAWIILVVFFPDTTVDDAMARVVVGALIGALVGGVWARGQRAPHDNDKKAGP